MHGLEKPQPAARLPAVQVPGHRGEYSGEGRPEALTAVGTWALRSQPIQKRCELMVTAPPLSSRSMPMQAVELKQGPPRLVSREGLAMPAACLVVLHCPFTAAPVGLPDQGT